MAKIKRSGQGQRQIDTGAVPNQLDPNAFTEKSKALDALGQTVVQVNEQLRKLRVSKQVMDADAATEFGILELRANAEADPNYENSKVYFDQLEAIRANAANNIENGPEKRAFQAKLNSKANIETFRLTKEFSAKLIDSSKESLENNISAKEAAFQKTLDQKERDGLIQQTNQLIDDAVRDGIVHADVGRERKEKIRNTWGKAAFVIDLYGDPSNDRPPASIEEIEQKMALGAYDMTPEEGAKAVKQLRTEKKARETQFSAEVDRLQTVNERDMFTGVMGKTKSVTDIIDGVISGEIGADIADDLLKLVRDPDSLVAVSADERFNELIKNGLSSDTFIRGFNRMIVQRVGDGLISMKDATTLLSIVNEDFENAEAKDFSNKVWGSAFKVATSGAVLGAERLFRAVVGAGSEKVLANYSRDLVRKLGAKKNPTPEDVRNISNELLDENIRRMFPGLDRFEKVPDTIHSAERGFNNVSQQPSNNEKESTLVMKNGKLVVQDDAPSVP